MGLKHRTLWLIWLVALLPLFLAVTMYFGGVWIPQQRVNNGDLIPPGNTLSQAALRNEEGELHHASGRWQLLLSTPKVCDELCHQWQADLNSILVLLGRERVEAHLVIKDENGVVLTAEERLIWLADPAGNLVLRYRQSQSPQALLKDLKRLLKLSKIG
ncbi:MAG: hypothetical protein MI754_08785 [Chromatiales bacterium]|nr:hypothetical protein [Chromatiales bacterium]